MSVQISHIPSTVTGVCNRIEPAYYTNVQDGFKTFLSYSWAMRVMATRPYVDKADHEVNMKVKQKDTKLAKALHSLNEKV